VLCQLASSSLNKSKKYRHPCDLLFCLQTKAVAVRCSAADVKTPGTAADDTCHVFRLFDRFFPIINKHITAQQASRAVELGTGLRFTRCGPLRTWAHGARRRRRSAARTPATPRYDDFDETAELELELAD
jgi:hypothetical protein